MRTKKFTPQNAGQIVEEIDLPEKATAAQAGAFRELLVYSELALKNILFPVLTPLVGADVRDLLPRPCSVLRRRTTFKATSYLGFNKDHQHFLFFRIRKPRTQGVPARDSARISTMEKVIAFRRLYRSKRSCWAGTTHTCVRPGQYRVLSSAIELLASKADADASAIAASSSGWRSARSYLGDPTRHRTTAPRASGRSADPRTKRMSCSFLRRITSACSTTWWTW